VSGNGCETTSKYHVTVLAAADKSAEADLLWEKNIVTRLLSQADKFKWTW
jgi:hypothetical protein